MAASEKNQKVIDNLLRRMGVVDEEKAKTTGYAPPSVNGHTPQDEVVLEQILSEQGGKFERLWRGDVSDFDNDHSRADDSFVHKLYSYTQDEEQIKRIHAKSGLHRPEKSGRRRDYLQRSIGRAREQVDWFYEWESPTLVAKNAAHSRSHSLGSTGMRNEGNENLKRSIQATSFAGREKPGPREWIIDNAVWKGHAALWYGAGGVAKSLLALHAGLTVAEPTLRYWCGFAVKTVPVLYLDFELDADEQHRRALQLVNGMGLEAIPERFYYLSTVGLSAKDAFEAAAEECRRLEVGLHVLDSVGFALEGDSESSRDVLTFVRRHLDPLKAAGVTPQVIDHQAKIIKGERYSDKEAFGSVYKTNYVRSAFQIRGQWDGNTVTVTFAHKKNNFGRQEHDFSVELTFGEGVIDVKRLPEPVLDTERKPSTKEQTLTAIRELGRTTAERVADKTGLDTKTVQNNVTDLIREGAVADTGEKEGRWRIVIPHSRTTKGTGTGVTLMSLPEEPPKHRREFS